MVRATWRGVSQERLDKAAEMLAEGKTRLEIYKETALSSWTMAKYFPVGRAWNVWPQERIDAVGRMLEDGMSHRDIGQTIGCSWNTITKYFPNSAWTRRQCVEHASQVRKLNSIKFV